MRSYLYILLCLLSFTSYGQFAPPDGLPGTTAMHQDSSAFVSWAKSAHILRGLRDISDTSQGFASVGDSSSCLNKADNIVVSLGDGGEALLNFPNGIYDGPGWDFAIFENSFVSNYLELAFVEVSSDGQNFYRFPAASLTQDTLQVGGFDFLDATKINNLAGKYRGTFGTPFDLSELSHHSSLDIQNITHIKIIDVVGSIDPSYGQRDTSDSFINDPWPTPFPSSGFDLDALGVIHQNGIGISENRIELNVYPNPASDFIRVDLAQMQNKQLTVSIMDLQGNLIHLQETDGKDDLLLDLNDLSTGQYVLNIKSSNHFSSKLISVLK